MSPQDKIANSIAVGQDVIAGLLMTPGGRQKLARAMVPPVLCLSCGRRDYDEGYRAGCKACTVRSVMET